MLLHSTSHIFLQLNISLNFNLSPVVQLFHNYNLNITAHQQHIVPIFAVVNRVICPVIIYNGLVLAYYTHNSKLIVVHELVAQDWNFEKQSIHALVKR